MNSVPLPHSGDGSNLLAVMQFVNARRLGLPTPAPAPRVAADDWSDENTLDDLRAEFPKPRRPHYCLECHGRSGCPNTDEPEFDNEGDE